ncbi:MAG: ribosome-associated translation inhibitor RaiA [Gammaproteobacteria bacterium]|nr:ribosome-associated translation inhibitor RaiA [Gammaproteobacteria bacterium]NNC97301.1 ribosome-associated translation inhibitor RaiA [Gammaproteobacteria bacterium]NNM14675.1 ribosome-associated translation inhibitor RaiA [Gammaproteobacteria bacterium]
MQINLTGHHVDVTSALKDFVESKMQRVERHFDHMTNANVILTVEKLRHKAEATINVSGAQVYADATEENMYSAIDGLVDKLDRQVKRHKEKIKDHHARKVDKRQRVPGI